jgi:hypothetical protein
MTLTLFLPHNLFNKSAVTEQELLFVDALYPDFCLGYRSRFPVSILDTVDKDNKAQLNSLLDLTTQIF